MESKEEILRVLIQDEKDAIARLEKELEYHKRELDKLLPGSAETA